MLAALPLLAFIVISIEPTQVDVAVGDVVPLRACFQPLYPPGPSAEMRVVSRAPEIAAVFGSKPAGQSCGDLHMTAVAPGVTVLDVFLDGSTDAVLHVYVTIESCEAFPKVPAYTVIRARAGVPVLVVPAVVNDGPAFYEWYAGELGDRSHLLDTRNLTIFTPAEAKAYPLWVEVRNRCSSKAGVVIVDATVGRRRAAR
jgi:hypothetical protein